ncbi:hypothetical protein PTTG_28369 [Puccinia triticina 1-1 BBBD Race 1]|uniref:ATP-dependent DNA helicase n=1 Tax=Puccinia triticina (isolate 1-1 / race 1 (BBBD)) TaxID=630390 RepID=A0A180GCF3_PUCT1|nr:hypothetical protein PTTG_28369 [Puccinia triticina 1-1 BBBD Race 1]
MKVATSTHPDYESLISTIAEYSFPHYLGRCNNICNGCFAFHWNDESTLADRKKQTKIYTMCCQKNKVSLPSVDRSAQRYPSLIRGLLTDKNQRSLDFQQLTRMYNNTLLFTSLGANIDYSVAGPMGVNVFKISGALTHRISSIEPASDDPGFCQIYVVGNRGIKEAQFRITQAQGRGGNTGLAARMDPQIVLELMDLLTKINPYAQRFRSTIDVLQRANAKTFKLQGVPTPGADPKRYNCPTIDEVAIVVQGNGDIISERQILLHRHDDGLKFISNLHSAYLPLRYPLFFPYGEQQWDNLYRATTSRGKPRLDNRKVESLEWFSFMLFRRRKKFSPILAGRSLFQEILVDIPRCMQQLYQDAMALCRKFGPPSYFITMTANPNLQEILDETPLGEKSFDHPTVVARVFYLKMKELISQLVKLERFGRVVAYVWTVEFQKRGLPHLHLMVTVDENDVPSLPEDIDNMISAELPDPIKSPVLHKLVCEFMLHGPCESRPCWNGNACRLGFPKAFSERTINVDGAYPVYLRRNDGRSITKQRSTFDNGSVVPYSPYLTRMFECHINVEVPVNTTAIKYLYKYITKGHDRLSLAIDSNDEVQSFIEGRYIGPCEAAWRLFKMPLSDRWPPVTRLSIHEEGEQLVYFKSQDGLEGQINNGKATQTSLTGFMLLNFEDAIGADGRHARDLFYEDVPTYFWWDKSRKIWVPRKTKDECVGRIFLVSYLAGERRVLLGLLVNDFLYNEALSEAAVVRSGYQLAQMFAMICVHSPPSDPLKLLNTHYLSFTDDQPRIDMRQRYSKRLNDAERKVMALFRLEDILAEMGSSLRSCGLNPTKKEARMLVGMKYDDGEVEELCVTSARLTKNKKKFNQRQKCFYLKVKNALHRRRRQLFYLDGPGGTGKTFALNTLIDLATVNEYNKIAVASSGVAALLLKFGQTAHSAFKIPIDAAAGVECPIDEDSFLALKLKDARLIIWDEVVTIHKNAIEAVNLTLKRICGSTDDFGGKVVIFSGDFRQILPVVKYNEYPPASFSTIKSSTLWDNISPFNLDLHRKKKNNIDFAASLLLLGEGKRQKSDYAVIKLRHINVASYKSRDEMRSALITFVYDDLVLVRSAKAATTYLNERCILAPLNKDVKKLNDEVLSLLPGDLVTLTSIDTPDPDSISSLPEECLNKLSFSGFPEHEISIKLGMPLVIIRNLSIGAGIRNGSRIRVVDFGIGFIRGRLMSGPLAGTK